VVQTDLAVKKKKKRKKKKKKKLISEKIAADG
jgi:hypothetical protein